MRGGANGPQALQDDPVVENRVVLGRAAALELGAIADERQAALRAIEAELSEKGEGERLVARIRILVLCLLLLTQVVPSANPLDNLIGFSLNVGALLLAVAIYFLASYRFRPWLAFASSGLDVTLVSVGLAGFLAFGQPQTAVNSKVVFEVYFLAIACASLRYDWRVCALCGALAVGQYAAIVAYAWRNFSFPGVGDADVAFGWNVQVGRLVVLAAAALLAVAAVLRAQRLRLLSTIDRLTGASNRGAFDQRLAEEESRARRYSRPFAVALIADFVQLALFPLFAEGALSPFQDALDVLVALTLLVTVGFRWRSLFAFGVELVPGLALFPTWTAMVLTLPAVDEAGARQLA